MSEIRLYEWIVDEFRVDSPLERSLIERLGPDLADLVRPGSAVLDLCCGTGPWSFFFEAEETTVTAIDFAPYMIELAREEAQQRGSQVDFIQADVFSHDLGEDRYELALLMGNSIADLRPSGISQLVDSVGRALRAGGRWAIQYLDGVANFEKDRSSGQGTQQEAPTRVTWSYRTYDAHTGSYVVRYTNESTGERYDYTTYIYTGPLIRQLTRPQFALERSLPISEVAFLDVFALS